MENNEENYFIRIQDLINAENSSAKIGVATSSTFMDNVFGWRVRIWSETGCDISVGKFHIEAVDDKNIVGFGETMEDAKHSFVYSVARSDSDYYAKRKYKNVYKNKFKKLKKQLKKAKKW